MSDHALTKRAPTMKATEHESECTQHEVGTGTTCDTKFFLSVDSEIVAQHAEAESKEYHIDSQQPSPKQEEAVEREGLLVEDNLPILDADRGIDSPSQQGDGKGKPEELAQNPIVKEKYLGSNFVLQKKDFQLLDEEKRRREAEEEALT